jgi:hypothetical protein
MIGLKAVNVVTVRDNPSICSERRTRRRRKRNLLVSRRGLGQRRNRDRRVMVMLIVLLMMLLSRSEMKGGEAVCLTFSRGIEDGCLCAFDYLSLFLVSGGFAFFACFFSAEVLSSFLFCSSMVEITDSMPFCFRHRWVSLFFLWQLPWISTNHKIIASLQTRLHMWYICLAFLFLRKQTLCIPFGSPQFAFTQMFPAC